MPQKRHVQTTENFLYMLPVAVARSFSNDSAIRYVLPVLWMTSYLLIIGKRLCGWVQSLLSWIALLLGSTPFIPV